MSDCEVAAMEYLMSQPLPGDRERQVEPQVRLREVVCPQCKKPFKLNWVDYNDDVVTLCIRSCPSGGIYDVIIRCPHCDYEEDL